ncbi:phospholipase D-like domain-containing protein [Lacipirellula parvula]|uniref:phospholipase D n=1 Tax=Lacipirellula parvula TaxID=2650471 RepID=A0A5K7X3S4_9BACT|nr:phospholipase D-like domain-containing protein [Lacipirellula parvula]BBO30447.1 hypothetical protein PLANPX_0059 [Lacipirellula parvula]
MAKATQRRLDDVAGKFGQGVPGLADELRAKLATLGAGIAPEGRAAAKLFVGDLFANEKCARIASASRFTTAGLQLPDEASERIIALNAGARPVARISNNQSTTNFIGPDSESWTAVIQKCKAQIDRAIPAVGRIEITNGDVSWVGTGWLIADNIVVTNRHVAQEFSRRDPTASGFIFRPGLLGSVMSCDIDFREEELRNDELEHPVTSVLWIAGSNEPDVAFLRVTRGPGQPQLPRPIELADEVKLESTIAAIGYPAEDPSIPDQELARRIFGDVYERKRLAPGLVTKVGEERIEHDCSTLGGNSGSVLIDLLTGRAVGLHHGGYLDDSANLAVSAPYLKKLLDRVIGEQPRRQAGLTDLRPAVESAPAFASTTPGTVRMTFNIPIEITVTIGTPVPTAIPAPPLPAVSAPMGAPPLEQALERAKQMFEGRPDVLKIRLGYRFKNGWITDERVVVIELREKLPYDELSNAGKPAFPRELEGVGIDIRTAPLPDQLEDLGIDMTVLERRARPAGYREPPGYNDPNSEMALKPFKAPMNAIFHVSPDSGFPNLKDFFGRVEDNLTATMYEWGAEHISDAIEAAISPRGNTLRMVTQKRGVGEGDATESAVEDMQERLGDKFSHVWASVRGPNRLIASSYHIKVASRDGKEFWLSSGNWKDSNQADIDPAGEDSDDDRPLRRHNREWHAIIEHKELATLFQNYIEYDFREAERVPLEDDEAVSTPSTEFFVPIEALEISNERRRAGLQYFDPLVITHNDGELDVRPLLTPDRDADDQRVFMKVATEMIRRATRTIYLQNQSFKMTDDDNDELVEFFTVLRDKQQAGLDVRIISRDARDFHRAADIVRQQELIERLKDFGFDTSPGALRLQPKCHTKGIIVDAQEVILGSHNLTNQGALFNRDASLHVRSSRVAEYFQKVFLFDWEQLARNEADERVGGIRIAKPGEEAPTGFRRVSLSELLGED